MMLKFPGQYKYSPRLLLQKCGYHLAVDKRQRKGSFVKRLTRREFPRFHIYLTHEDGYFQISLHLDHKKVSYESQIAHSGEYSGHLVEVEAERLRERIDDWELD